MSPNFVHSCAMVKSDTALFSWGIEALSLMVT
jgi:hypothetical protein